MITLNDKLDKICELPRLPRREVAKILKEIYNEGVKNGMKRGREYINREYNLSNKK